MTIAERVVILVLLIGIVSYAAVLVGRDIRETRLDVELHELLADQKAVQDDANEWRS